MRYELIKGSCNNLQHIVNTALINRGISNVTKYMNASEKDCEHYSLLDNINEAYDLFMEHVMANHYIEILVDCDCDGFTSAAVLYDYMVNNYDYKNNLGYIIHSRKAHGLSDKDIKLDERTKLLIIPDASSNEEGLHEDYRTKYGVDIIVLDHHQCDDGYSEFATVVNNQLSNKYKNKNLSGVGVVYKFLQKCDDEFDDWTYMQTRTADYYVDLVAIGMIGDVMNMSTLENRYLINKGLGFNRNNELLKTVMDLESYSLGFELTPIKVSFNIVPLINAMIRMGTVEEQEVLFKALCNYDEVLPYEGRAKKSSETIQECALRLCKNAKSKQSRIRDKATQEILQRIKDTKADEHAVIMVDVTDILDTQFTGLVAIKIAEYFNKPCLLCRNVKEIRYQTTAEDFLDEMFPDAKEPIKCVGGSGRNPSTSGLYDFRKFCTDTGLFNYCQGHSNAFGFEITMDNMEEFLNKADELLANINEEKVIYVDADVNFEYLPDNCFMDAYNARKVWSTGIEEPLVHMSNVWCNTKDITISDKGYMRIKIDDIEFTQMGVNETHPIYVLLDDLFGSDADIELEVIGTVGMNDFRGNLTKQVKITEVEIKKVEHESEV